VTGKKLISRGVPAIFLVFNLVGCALGPISGVSERAGSARYVFLVRHAERYFDSREDPPLTPAGHERARALAETLRDAGIAAIITTQWQRTRDTAQRLATLLGIKLEVVPVHEGQGGKNIEETAAAVRRHKGETVLVVGHVTVSGVIQALGGPQLPTICENVFSDLFLFVPALGENGLVRLRYGASEEISPTCRNLPEPERR